MSWVKRVEAVMDVLKGSSISEIELAEGEFEIILRRNPGTVVTVKALHHDGVQHTDTPISDSRFTELQSPLTGVYYTAGSPDSAPFVKVGDTIKVGQIIALIEAMKVFNEIQAEAGGRVVAIKALSGDVVKKGEVLFLVEPV
jgi:acetyl-CoA carboxylase biotin carboxyl carrier protein